MNKRKAWLFTFSGVLCLAFAILSLLVGSVKLSLSEIVNAIAAGPTGTAGWIFWYLRLPRTVACLLSGAALAVSGAVIQSVLSNHLASPSIIGVNSGAGLAVTCICAFGVMSGWMISAAAFFGALATVLIVVFVSRKVGASRSTVIMGGVAMNSFLNAVSQAIVALIPDVGVMSSDFRIGGFSSVVYTRLVPAGIIILLALIAVMTLCNELDVLSLGEDTAQSLGLPVKRYRIIFLIIAALLAGASVSFAGLLGFVGLIVPHIVRRFVGNESKYVLPLSAIVGAGLVTACDFAARVIFAPYELQVGIIMAVLGGPFFIMLLLKRRGERTND